MSRNYLGMLTAAAMALVSSSISNPATGKGRGRAYDPNAGIGTAKNRRPAGANAQARRAARKKVNRLKHRQACR